jgi:FtsZ-binding cell division protein ZapB
MQFYLDNLLEYDFRMKVGSLFLRVKGQFYDEDQLSTRITEAATDPVRFLERTDPEYLFRTFQETANVLQQLEGGATNAIDSLRELVVGYQALRDERPVVERRLNELTAERDRLSTELETLQAAHGDLQTRHEALKEQAEVEAQAEAAELERSRLGFLAVQNAGLFSGPRPMDPALVSRVLALKRANGAVTTEEILATLKAESISGNKKQVELIILAYFGPPAAGS